MIAFEKNEQVIPICPHCKKELTKVQFQQIKGDLGKHRIYFCLQCRSTLGVSQIIAANRAIQEQCETLACSQDILAFLRRRSCSIEDISLGLGLHRNAIVKCIEQLCSQQQARVEHTTQGRFYKALI